MAYVRPWERLADALTRVMAAAGRSQEEAQTDICQAITDKAIKIQGQLKEHTTRHITSRRVLEGKDFELPARIKPADVDWESSRPLRPWAVHREIFGLPGSWELEWIELFRTDVTNVLCAGDRGGLAERTSSKTGVTSRSRPVRERARQAINELYPQGLPSPVELPNWLLCRRVRDKLKERGLLGVSDDTILRAARRRHK